MISKKLIGLIVLIILEQVCNNSLCTSVCRSLSIVVLLQFITYNMSNKVNNTNVREILRNINKLTTPSECQSNYDEFILDSI